MDISSSANEVTITGNIKSVNDFQSIKSTIDSIKDSTSTITIDIQDSISITSSVIGYLNKLVLKDSIDLNMKVGNKQLMLLLEDLNLTGTFKAKRR
ncbi:MAG: hypothetical protein J7K14_09315 [Sulfurimonas sp.]|nr:hypothetical protein [Sulfurimonas sp.]